MKHNLVYIIIMSLLLTGCGNVAEVPVETSATLNESDTVAVTAHTEEYEPEIKNEPTAEPVPFLEETIPVVVSTPAPIPDTDGADYISELMPALYLRTTPYCARHDNEQRDYFIRAANSGVVSAGNIEDDPVSTAEGADSLVYSQPDGFSYLRLCAAVAGLVDCGTFIDTENATEQYAYLTGVNKFTSKPLSSCRGFGGDSSVSAGDVVFFFDADGNAVSSALITAANPEYITCVLRGWGDVVVRLELDASMLKSDTLENSEVVNIIYPSVEFRIYSFLTAEMGFTPAAACGVMANMYKESMFISATGKSTYGLCQWQGDRLTSFLNWCYSKKYDSSALTSQLLFFRKELTEDNFTELNEYLLSLGNSEEDAFNAAKQFCIQYEKPSNAYALGNDRGDLAKEFYKIYCS